ncbi:MAG: outer membrane protein assembly factor BamE [Alphaproteobacteria bacterium]|nr:outer membrane protein assembly factor BamE [Alphaproteobacteria bacterium]
MIKLLCRPSFLALALLLSMGACAPVIANRGNLIEPEKLAEIKVGTSTREEVATKLGSPTEIGTFDETTWYYFGRSTEQYSFFDPEVTKQQTVEIHFDDQGVVTALNTIDPGATQEIEPVSRRTPTYGKETTFFEQLMGNLGKPSAGKKK